MSDDKVVRFVPQTTGFGDGEPQEEVIATLEAYLGLAKTGALRAVMVAGVLQKPAGVATVYNIAYGTGPYQHSMGFALSCMSHEFWSTEIKVMEAYDGEGKG